MATTIPAGAPRNAPTIPARHSTLHIGISRRLSVFAVSGPIDAETVGELRRRVRSHVAKGAGTVVLDLTGGDRLTAASYAGVVGCAWDVVADGGAPMRLVVDAGRPAVSLTQLVGLGHLLALYESLDEACHPEPAPPLTVALTVSGTTLHRTV
ncbi:STAS domain-containing protein [Actinomycetospora endophytica]|uniref:STAS domain-containing protein n=1 Tax=Actinomycetospora endophytica TaxID=2291215 RepID=A0ABS8PF50_9PSEU|nr:STAS domain-containing protein [Actinomycetospora endophytica]MCD2196883.1 STAS domain-containing protein [Actinomycetospora endophytica]